MSYTPDENIAFLQRKIPIIIVAISVFFLIVLARLYYLQVMEGPTYEKLATEIFLREEELVARRGNILDRDGKVLADTKDYYEIVITPQYIQNRDRVIDSLVKILPLKKQDILDKLYLARYEAKFRPIPIAEDVPYNWVAKLQEYFSPAYVDGSEYDLSGVNVRHYPLRHYLHPKIFSHALGYLTEIDKPRLKKAKVEQPGVFSLGDLTGAAGVERAYDIQLKGKDGALARVVDARGREAKQTPDLKVLQTQATVLPEAGFTLRTTLDFDAQMMAHKAFKGRKGAVVALDPNTGEILVLYSSPGYDGNRITKNVDKDYWRKINLDEDKYLFNRAIQAMYPPASTYKVVVLAAGIDSGKIDPEKTKFRCAGGLRYGNRFFKCWRSGGHGRLSALFGLSRSCDVFFYNVGLKVGVDGIARYAKIFGLGSPTGIEIPFEKPGLVPSTEWKKKRYGQKWYESETLSVAIGQSYNLMTPLQNAVVVSLIANGGYRVTPHLGIEILDGDGKVMTKVEYPTQETELIGSEALKWVKKGMIEVVHGHGTARRLRKSPDLIAGKTGTAQVVSHGAKVKAGVNIVAHALFIAFAPYDNPKIAVSVMVEHGRGGSSTAAPIAMQVIDAYLSKKGTRYGGRLLFAESAFDEIQLVRSHDWDTGRSRDKVLKKRKRVRKRKTIKKGEGLVLKYDENNLETASKKKKKGKWKAKKGKWKKQKKEKKKKTNKKKAESE